MVDCSAGRSQRQWAQQQQQQQLPPQPKFRHLLQNSTNSGKPATASTDAGKLTTTPTDAFYTSPFGQAPRAASRPVTGTNAGKADAAGGGNGGGSRLGSLHLTQATTGRLKTMSQNDNLNLVRFSNQALCKDVPTHCGCLQ